MSKKNPFAGLTAEQINDVLKQAEAAKAQLVTKPATPAGKPLPPFSVSVVEKDGIKRVKVEGHCQVPLVLKPEQFVRLLSKSGDVLSFIKANNLG